MPREIDLGDVTLNKIVEHFFVGHLAYLRDLPNEKLREMAEHFRKQKAANRGSSPRAALKKK